MNSNENIDSQVISDFGDEWATYNYEKSELSKELKLQFEMYSSLVNFQEFNPLESVAADFGAGTGRWAGFVLGNFKKIYLVEPSQGAFEVLTKKFKSESHVSLENSTISDSAIPKNSLDFAMSLGVLHPFFLEIYQTGLFRSSQSDATRRFLDARKLHTLVSNNSSVLVRVGC